MMEKTAQEARWRQPGLREAGLRVTGLTVAGAGLLIATGAIHLDLYLTGYRSIPTIGWLFLFQVIAAFGLGAAVLATAVLGRGSTLAAAAGAAFSLATLGGYLLTVWFGLFGFKEVRTTAGIVAGVIEVAGFAALAALAVVTLAAVAPRTGAGNGVLAMLRPGARMTAAVSGLAVIGLALLAEAAATSGSQAATATGGGLSTVKIGNVTVLTNAKGLTLYSFAPDSSTASKCYGSCAAYWPPVTGSAKVPPGVPGKLGTIKRSDGSQQVTYNGHPLYTYIADSGRGQARGNNLNLNGGLWHEIVVSGS
jgi:predicted lipoprotein with Yx(FWY)xxD motif